MQFDVTITLGPASEQPSIRRRLLATADRLRINTSFFNHLQLRELFKELVELFRSQHRELPVVLDLQGSKMRIGDYPPCRQLPLRIRLCYASASADPVVIPVPHQELFEQCRSGDRLLLNDARIELEAVCLLFRTYRCRSSALAAVNYEKISR